MTYLFKQKIVFKKINLKPALSKDRMNPYDRSISLVENLLKNFKIACKRRCLLIIRLLGNNLRAPIKSHTKLPNAEKSLFRFESQKLEYM